MRSFLLLIVLGLVHSLRGAPTLSGSKCVEESARPFIKLLLNELTAVSDRMFRQLGVESEAKEFKRVQGEIHDEISETAKSLYKASNEDEFTALRRDAEKVIESKGRDWAARIGSTMVRVDGQSTTAGAFSLAESQKNFGKQVLEIIEIFAKKCFKSGMK